MTNKRNAKSILKSTITAVLTSVEHLCSPSQQENNPRFLCHLFPIAQIAQIARSLLAPKSNTTFLTIACSSVVHHLMLS